MVKIGLLVRGIWDEPKKRQKVINRKRIDMNRLELLKHGQFVSPVLF